MKRRIEQAAVVIADLTGANPNVYLEVGYAWGVGKATVLLMKTGEEPKFDVRGYRQVRYESMRNLEDLLARELQALADEKGWADDDG